MCDQYTVTAMITAAVILVLLPAFLMSAETKIVPRAPMPPVTPSTEFILFDITTEKSSSYVETVLKDIEDLIIYKYKVIGVGRYLVLVYNDQSTDLKTLELPGQVKQYPVVHIYTYFANFRAEWREPDFSYIPDGNLTFVERTLELDDMNSDQFKAIMDYQASIQIPLPLSHIFVPAGFFPVKFFFFMNTPDAVVSRLFTESADIFGGPGTVHVQAQKIMNF
nr:hypothetical protein BaRGS_026894 [Batillaria attramentaria]